ncbi:leucine-rich repeat-containing protein 52-like [Thalassophryne amazonica]|uniref:leucine-rich repeat-containing protein 52-like n=1 Tax=Thalassophryne amazonica TaxID=390379 RepID=UPI0014722297|nr:leucine-rich repeat-containing protein 52-like [Thalassophryne amazonica]
MRLAPQPITQPFLVLLILTTDALASPVLSPGCPDRCVCDDQLVVQCAGQHLTTFPANLPLATRQLIISNNRIAELPPLTLNYLSDLVYLDCSNNSLTEISESTFGNLRKLTYLDLSFNALTRIEDRTFGPLASLVMLRMTDNPALSEIHAEAFVENLALQVLDVSRNNLTVLNITALIALSNLRSVGLSGNPWSCACHNEDLCLWIHLAGFKFQDEVQTVCSSPPDMRRRRLGEVGIQLRQLCHQSLGSWDYLFFVVIGFVIFAAGTVSAWVMGIIMVLYERYIKKKDQQLDPDNENEPSETRSTSRSRREHRCGNTRTSLTV